LCIGAGEYGKRRAIRPQKKDAAGWIFWLKDGAVEEGGARGVDAV